MAPSVPTITTTPAKYTPYQFKASDFMSAFSPGIDALAKDNQDRLLKISQMRSVDPATIQAALSDGGSMAGSIGFNQPSELLGMTPDQVMAITGRAKSPMDQVSQGVAIADQISGLPETRKALSAAETNRAAMQGQLMGTAASADVSAGLHNNQGLNASEQFNVGQANHASATNATIAGGLKGHEISAGATLKAAEISKETAFKIADMKTKQQAEAVKQKGAFETFNKREGLIANAEKLKLDPVTKGNLMMEHLQQGGLQTGVPYTITTKVNTFGNDKTTIFRAADNSIWKANGQKDSSGKPLFDKVGVSSPKPTDTIILPTGY